MSRVVTKLGSIIGQKITPKGCLSTCSIDRYLGIPYAQPPLGALRFRRPVPIQDKWSEPLLAKQWPAQCPQLITLFYHDGDKLINNENFSEDCLYLNVWSPDVHSLPRKPVLVWIHGGGLVAGTASFDLYDGELIAAKLDVVVVSFNYRLGTLGFIVSSENEDIQGNQGLWDQAAALKWVHENISSFGGDPNRVTIMGQSAGGWSVSLHLLSPITRHLFQNAVVMSGAATNLVVKPEVQIEHYLSAFRKMGLAKDTDMTITKEMISKLESMPADKLAALYFTMEKLNTFERKSLVVIDGTFLPEPVGQMLRNGNYKKSVNLLSSIVEDEASFYLSYTRLAQFKDENPEPFTFQQAQDFLKKLITEDKPFESTGLNSETIPVDLAVKYYFRGLDPTADEQNEYRKRFGIALGDYWLGTTTVNFAKDIYRFSEEKAKVFQWYYKAKTENISFLGNAFSGVTHCDELFPLFGMPFRYPEKYSDRERAISEDILTFLGSFIWNGTPGVEWQPFFTVANSQHLVAPYYEINNEPKSADNFKYNLKQIECEAIWGQAKLL